ncbi:15548_t:CDS:1, partial [Entrophospora sp. SA101]
DSTKGRRKLLNLEIKDLIISLKEGINNENGLHYKFQKFLTTRVIGHRGHLSGPNC